MYKSLVELCTEKTGGLGEQRRGEGATATARKLLFETQKTVIKLRIVGIVWNMCEPTSFPGFSPTRPTERERKNTIYRAGAAVVSTITSINWKRQY